MLIQTLFYQTKCLHNRPDDYIIKRPSLRCQRHHACAEVSGKPNKKDDDQTCKKSGCFDTRKPCLNCSFQDDNTRLSKYLSNVFT